MKAIVKIMMMFCVINIIAQKVKIKKGILSIDKVEVCQFQKVKTNTYDINDLEGKPVLKLVLKADTAETLQGDERLSQIKFSNTKDSDFYYSAYDLKGLKFSLSTEKTLARHLIKKNQFLSKDGINYKNIEEFFSVPRSENKEIVNKFNEYEKAYQSVEDFDLKIDGKNIIKGEVIVGYYKIEYQNNPEKIIIRVFDAKNFLTATYDLGYIVFFDNKKVKFILLGNNQNDNAVRVIERMIIAGYTLGDTLAKK